MNKKYCLALDLKPDEALIAEYERAHQAVWPEVLDSIRAAGIVGLEIYRIENRLFMVMETTEHFSFAQKAAMDSANPKVQAWEEWMWTFQQALPTAKTGEKWLLMEKIFEL